MTFRPPRVIILSMKTKTLSVLALAVFILAALGCNALTVKGKLRTANQVFGKALVASYEATYSYLGSAAGTDAVCARLVTEHASEIKAGTYTVAMLDADCVALIAAAEKTIDRALNASSLSLETWEHGLDMWDSMDGGDQLKLVKDVAAGLVDLLQALEDCGVPIPEKLKALRGTIDSLITIIGG